jgi:hypothetical protein
MAGRNWKRVDDLLFDLEMIYVGGADAEPRREKGERVRSLHLDLDSYLNLPPAEGLRKAQADMERIAEKQAELPKRHIREGTFMSEEAWWDLECEEMLYACLVEVYENLEHGIPLKKFPPLRDRQGRWIGRLEGQSSWINQMKELREKPEQATKAP